METKPPFHRIVLILLLIVSVLLGGIALHYFFRGIVLSRHNHDGSAVAPVSNFQQSEPCDQDLDYETHESHLKRHKRAAPPPAKKPASGGAKPPAKGAPPKGPPGKGGPPPKGPPAKGGPAKGPPAKGGKGGGNGAEAKKEMPKFTPEFTKNPRPTPEKVKTVQDWVHECRSAELTVQNGYVWDAWLVIEDDPNSKFKGDYVTTGYNFNMRLQFGQFIPAFWRIYDPYHTGTAEAYYGYLCGPVSYRNRHMKINQHPCPLPDVDKDFQLTIKMSPHVAKVHNPARLELYGLRSNGTEFISVCLEVGLDADERKLEDTDRFFPDNGEQEIDNEGGEYDYPDEDDYSDYHLRRDVRDYEEDYRHHYDHHDRHRRH